MHEVQVGQNVFGSSSGASKSDPILVGFVGFVQGRSSAADVGENHLTSLQQ
jgi:hypothetical protein